MNRRWYLMGLAIQTSSVHARKRMYEMKWSVVDKSWPLHEASFKTTTGPLLHLAVAQI